MKKIVLSFVFFLLVSFVCPVFAQAAQPERIIDNAGLLSSSEEAELEDRISGLEEEYGVNLVLLTENRISGTAVTYADDYYDEHGYSQDGVLLLINMQRREWYISTAGKCIGWLTDYGIQEIGDMMAPSFSDGEYADGFFLYLDCLDQFFKQGEKGAPYDVNHVYKHRTAFGFTMIFFGSLLVGLLVAFSVLSAMKRKMKTAVFQPAANEYLKDRQFQVTDHHDRFLYSTVTRTAIPRDTDTSSGGGSSTHTSSSGSSHGGGGGHF